MPRRRFHAGCRFILLAFLMALCGRAAAQVGDTSSLLEVFWHGSQTLTITGLSNAVSEDDSICRSRIEGD